MVAPDTLEVIRDAVSEIGAFWGKHVAFLPLD